MAEPGDLTEFVGTNDSSAAVQFSEHATGGQLFVSIHRGGVDVSCVASWEGQFDAVKVTSNGKHGAATIEPLGPVNCSPPVGSLTLECEFNDDFWLYNDGVTKRIVMGERTSDRSRSWFASADCRSPWTARAWRLVASSAAASSADQSKKGVILFHAFPARIYTLFKGIVGATLRI
jgi:hypothetical protein